MSHSTVLPEDSAPPWRGSSLRRAISHARDQPLWRALIGPSRKSMRSSALPDEFTHECLAICVARKLKAIFAAWPAALRQPAPPATLAQRPAFHLDHSVSAGIPPEELLSGSAS